MGKKEIEKENECNSHKIGNILLDYPEIFDDDQQTIKDYAKFTRILKEHPELLGRLIDLMMAEINSEIEDIIDETNTDEYIR